LSRAGQAPLSKWAREATRTVAFVHAKEQELKAVEEGYFVNRHDVMYNAFVIIGPSEDPARITGMKSAVEAFKKIAASSIFISRGDKSGTNTKRTCYLGKGRHCSERPEVVSRSRTGHGEDPENRRREARIYAY